MYVIVFFDGLHGDEKRLIVNPNCRVRVILNYIMSEIVNSGIAVDEDQDVDLCEIDGVPLRLISTEPSLNAFEAALLKPRSVYYPVLFRRDEKGELTNPNPLSSKISDKFQEYIQRGRKYSLPFLQKLSAKAVTKPTKPEKPERTKKGPQKN